MNETVIIYSLDSCPCCQELKKKMDDKNIKYTEVKDIGLMKSMGFTYVPHLQVGETILDEDDAIAWVESQMMWEDQNESN